MSESVAMLTRRCATRTSYLSELWSARITRLIREIHTWSKLLITHLEPSKAPATSLRFLSTTKLSDIKVFSSPWEVHILTFKSWQFFVRFTDATCYHVTEKQLYWWGQTAGQRQWGPQSIPRCGPVLRPYAPGPDYITTLRVFCLPRLGQPRKQYTIECIILLSESGWNDLFWRGFLPSIPTSWTNEGTLSTKDPSLYKRLTYTNDKTYLSVSNDQRLQRCKSYGATSNNELQWGMQIPSGLKDYIQT